MLWLDKLSNKNDIKIFNEIGSIKWIIKSNVILDKLRIVELKIKIIYNLISKCQLTKVI